MLIKLCLTESLLLLKVADATWPEMGLNCVELLLVRFDKVFKCRRDKWGKTIMRS